MPERANTSTVFLGLGSNLGDREHNIKQALDELKEYHVAIKALSGIYETAPVGGPHDLRLQRTRLRSLRAARRAAEPKALREVEGDAEVSAR